LLFDPVQSYDPVCSHSNGTRTVDIHLVIIQKEDARRVDAKLRNDMVEDREVGLGTPVQRRLIERINLRGRQAERERSGIVGCLLAILRPRDGQDTLVFNQPS
jgi:hypothetical protein